VRDLDSLPLDASECEYELFTAKTELGSLAYRDPVAGALYNDWYRRVEPAGEQRFSAAEMGKFALLAAASGIAGNAAYDAIKNIIRHSQRDIGPCRSNSLYRPTSTRSCGAVFTQARPRLFV
jgi:hypothetical protein